MSNEDHQYATRRIQNTGMADTEELANHKASCSITTTPTVIREGSALASKLMSNETQYILPYEHACYNTPDTGPATFIATKGVFTCVALFAWAPSGRVFGAHITAVQLHYGCRNYLSGRDSNLLPEITHALKWTFKKESNPRKDVRVHLVGGQAEQDDDHGLRAHFPNDAIKHSIAWHIIGAVQRAGLTVDAESTRLLNVFDGIPFHHCFEQEQRAKGQSFSLVALNRRTGGLVTHTLVEKAESYHMACLGERGVVEDSRYMSVYTSAYARQGRRSLRVEHDNA
jgi:hypothetical protein